MAVDWDEIRGKTKKGEIPPHLRTFVPPIDEPMKVLFFGGRMDGKNQDYLMSSNIIKKSGKGWIEIYIWDGQEMQGDHRLFRFDIGSD